MLFKRLKVEDFHDPMYYARKEEKSEPLEGKRTASSPLSFLGCDLHDQRRLVTDGVVNSSRGQLSNFKPYRSAPDFIISNATSRTKELGQRDHAEPSMPADAGSGRDHPPAPTRFAPREAEKA